jgi:hypothetical protein
MPQTTEHAFETYVEEILLSVGGWKSGSNAEWDKERALFAGQVLSLLAATQPKLWAELGSQLGAGLEPLVCREARSWAGDRSEGDPIRALPASEPFGSC